KLTPPSPGHPFRPRAVGVVHEGRAFGVAAEARVAAIETDRAMYALGLIAPGKDVDRLGWMAAKRALEVAWWTLNRPEEGVMATPGMRREAVEEAPQAPEVAEPERMKESEPERRRWYMAGEEEE